MIWLVTKNESFQITGQNLFHNKKEEQFELWGTRLISGKTILIFASKEEEEVKLLRDAIDYAIEHGEKTFTLLPE